MKRILDFFLPTILFSQQQAGHVWRRLVVNEVTNQNDRNQRGTEKTKHWQQPGAPSVT